MLNIFFRTCIRVGWAGGGDPTLLWHPIHARTRFFCPNKSPFAVCSFTRLCKQQLNASLGHGRSKRATATPALYLISAIQFVLMCLLRTYAAYQQQTAPQGGQGDNGFIDIPMWATETMLVANQSVSFLEAVAKDTDGTASRQKFSLTVSFNKPHPPYLVARPYWERLAGGHGLATMRHIQESLERHAPWPLDGRYPHGEHQFKCTSVG